MKALAAGRAGDLARWGVGAALLAIFTWPLVVAPPAAGLDPSWRAGLNMAWRDSVAFGHDLIFTYGPWGFTSQPALYDAGAYRIAVLVTLALWLGASLAVWVAVARTWGRGWAWPIAALVLCSALLIEPGVIASIAIAVLLVQRVDRPLAPWVPLALGAAAGFLLLGKASTGAQIALVLGVALAFGPPGRLRAVLLYAGAAVVALLLSWLVAGQSLGDLPAFVRGSAEIIVGYGPAMSLADDGIRWAYWAALALALVVALGVRAAMRGSAPVSATGLAVVSGLIVFASFKQGFVRNDAGHATLFFGAMIVLVAVLPWGRAYRGEAALALGLALCAFFGVSRIEPASIVNPIQAPQDLAKTVRLTFRSAERDRLVEQGRAAMQAGYALTPATLAALDGKTVHVLPWEIGAAWAYRMRWSPLPVFQDYSAYTSYLDGKNADRLASPRGPERILQQAPTSIDGRLPGWDPPRQNVELLCRFRPISEQTGWRVLERGPNRCGAEREVSTVKTTWGTPVPVPAVGRNELLTVEVDGLKPHGLESLRSLAWKPAERSARLDDGKVIRVIPGTAGDGLLLRAPAAIDAPGPFHLSPAPQTLTFLRGKPGGSQPSGDLTLRFVTRPVTAASSSAP